MKITFDTANGHFTLKGVAADTDTAAAMAAVITMLTAPKPLAAVLPAAKPKLAKPANNW